MTTKNKLGVLDTLGVMAGHLLKVLGSLAQVVLVVLIGFCLGVAAFILVLIVSTLVGAAAGWVVSLVPFIYQPLLNGLALVGVHLEPGQLALFCATLSFISAFFYKGGDVLKRKQKTPEEKRAEAFEKMMKDISRK